MDVMTHTNLYVIVKLHSTLCNYVCVTELWPKLTHKVHGALDTNPRPLETGTDSGSAAPAASGPAPGSGWRSWPALRRPGGRFYESVSAEKFSD
jgi:hypothetical protein